MRKAFNDWKDSVCSYELWLTLAVQEIKQRYRRSVLGPLWITITMLVTVGFIGPLYGKLFSYNVKDFIIGFTISFIVWNFLSTTINEFCFTYVNSEQFLRQVKLPYSLYIIKVLVKNFIIFMHNVLVIILVILIFKPSNLLYLPLSIFGLFLVLLNLNWIGIFLSLLCTRFRDLGQLVANIMQLFFFVTPILWHADRLGKYQSLINYNMFYHFIDVIKTPIVYGSFNFFNLVITMIVALLGNVFAFIFFSKYRSRIAFWI